MFAIEPGQALNINFTSKLQTLQVCCIERKKNVKLYNRKYANAMRGENGMKRDFS